LRAPKVLKRAAARANIDHLSPHALRHTFGHRWLKTGGDVYVLSKVLGHSSVVTTERHYAHVLKEDLSAAMEARDLGISE
jgi:integrase/recombinase XerD